MERKLIQFLNRKVFAFFIIFFSQFGFAQEITIDKEITENALNCQQFDVTLTITGNPIIQPQEVVLLIDVSGSMADSVDIGGGNTEQIMELAKDAATDFVNSLFLPVNNPTGQNKVSIVSYSLTGNVEIPLTADIGTGKQDIIDAINDLNPGGGTNMEDALIEAKNVLTTGATFNCATSRNVILLTDGIPSRDNDGRCDLTGIPRCKESAVTAANDLKTLTVLGEDYDQTIFAVGFIGTLDTEDEAESRDALGRIQNGGAFFTDQGADLTGIYNNILGQLVAAAIAIDGESLVKDLIPIDFQIEANSLTATKGNFTITGQQIDWFIDRIVDETVTLSYSIIATADECGITNPGTSVMNYINSSCVTAEPLTFTNPQVCIPCPETVVALVKNGCKSVDFSSTVNQVSCTATSENYSWKFFLDGLQIGTSTAASGTYTYTGTDKFSGDFTAELDYQGFYESNCPATMVQDNASITVDCSSDLSLKIRVDSALPKVGDTINYILTIKNDGPEEASDIEVSNVLPSGLSYNDTGSNIPLGTSFNNGLWDLNNITIPNGDSLVLNLAVTVNGAGTFTNTAKIIKAVNEDDLDSTPGNGI